MAGGIGSNVQVWNVETGELFAFLESQAMVDQSLNFKRLTFRQSSAMGMSNDGTKFVVGYMSDATVRVWDITRPTLKEESILHSAEVCVGFGFQIPTTSR